jgi:hypothetical protein
MATNIKESIITTAEQEAADAEQNVIDLEQKVVEGDTSITAAAIDKARQASRFAKLKVEAAFNQTAKEAETERAKAVAAYMAEYEAFCTEDLAPLQDAYQEAVLILADLDAMVKERLDAQREIIGKSHVLGSAVFGDQAPVRADADRWRNILVGKDVLDGVVTEARFGYVLGANGPGASHALHTPARKADMEAIRKAGDRADTGRKLLDAFIAANQSEA